MLLGKTVELYMWATDMVSEREHKGLGSQNQYSKPVSGITGRWMPDID